MFARVSQSASECCPERGRMRSRLRISGSRISAIEFKKRSFQQNIPWNLEIHGNFHENKKI
jgi:hypothetical protein